MLLEEGSDATEVMNHPALAKKGVGLSVADKLAVTRAALGHFPDETGPLAAPSARQWCCGFCNNGPKFFSFHTLADLKEVKKHMRNHNPGLGAVLDGTVTFAAMQDPDEYEPTSKQITAEQCRSRYKVTPQPAGAIKNNKERLPNLKAYAA